MLGRATVRRLVLLCLCAVALGHGFAGAATHVAHHPPLSPVPAAGAPSAWTEDATQPHGQAHGDGHVGPACDIVTGSAPGSSGPAAGLPVCPRGTEPPVLLPLGGAAPSRSPPEPSLIVLSVLRI
ncbi:hypothetical protein [Streptomyces sp. NPDC090029]|uniref:hypothetical protein n=1 Tax=Streptomyces sp. NPDC090029 TaxID=3365924 RepID=UPI0037FA2C41